MTLYISLTDSGLNQISISSLCSPFHFRDCSMSWIMSLSSSWSEYSWWRYSTRKLSAHQAVPDMSNSTMAGSWNFLAYCVAFSNVAHAKTASLRLTQSGYFSFAFWSISSRIFCLRFLFVLISLFTSSVCVFQIFCPTCLLVTWYGIVIFK